MTEGFFSMAMMVDHRSDSAKAITFPPAPANISIKTDFEGETSPPKSSATLLLTVRWLENKGVGSNTLQ